jgi:hypothetical protein
MKKYLIFYLAIQFLVTSADIKAQVSTSSIVGFNMSNMELNAEGNSIPTEGGTGIHFGMVFSVPLTDYLALRPGAIFTSKGTAYKIDTVRISISPIYIEIPVNAALTFGTQNLGVTLTAGTYLSCGVGGNKIVGVEESKDILYGSGEDKDLKLFDFGVNFGAGFNFRGFLISAQYELGLANLSPLASADMEIKNSVVGISLISSFSGR